MPFYLTAIYFISFSHTHLGVAHADAIQFSIYNMLAMMCIVPISAWISDRVGRRKVLAFAAAAIALSCYPLFTFFEQGESLFNIGMVQFVFSLLLGVYMGPIAAVLVELFPTRVRFSGMAIAYNLSAAIFGGTAPLVCEWLIKETGSNQSIAFYVIACNVVSLVAIYFFKDRHHEPLR
jgi:MHS family proline/betaine transporter-like MFS transporter